MNKYSEMFDEPTSWSYLVFDHWIDWSNFWGFHYEIEIPASFLICKFQLVKLFCSFSHLLDYFSTFFGNKSSVNNKETKVVKKDSEEIIRFKRFKWVKSLNCSFCETEVEPFFTLTCDYVMILLQFQIKSNLWNFRKKVK